MCYVLAICTHQNYSKKHLTLHLYYTNINDDDLQVFDAISYCKGSAVVNMVCAVLGKEKFREGLQLYMKKHAYGSSETMDLWNAWSEVEKKKVVSCL